MTANIAARLMETACRAPDQVAVAADLGGPWAGGRHRVGEPLQLPQHGFSVARISFTEKSAAASTESAAP